MYLNDDQIDLMAKAAVCSYEMSADWNNARVAVYEYAVDKFGIKPRKSAVLLAMKIAKSTWHGVVINTRKQIELA